MRLRPDDQKDKARSTETSGETVQWRRMASCNCLVLNAEAKKAEGARGETRRIPRPPKPSEQEGWLESIVDRKGRR